MRYSENSDKSFGMLGSLIWVSTVFDFFRHTAESWHSISTSTLSYPKPYLIASALDASFMTYATIKIHLTLQNALNQRFFPSVVAFLKDFPHSNVMFDF